MFRTMYDEKEHKRIISNPGDPVKEEYQLRIQKDHSEILEPVGKSSFYDYIQSHADSVDIHKILERCAMIDDYSILNRMPAKFMDTTEMPKTLAEAFSMVQDAKTMFDRFPIEIKEKYDNNFVDFLGSLGTTKFDNIAGEYLKSIQPKEENVKEIVKDNVEKS